MMQKIILASQSPQRRAIMDLLGHPFEVVPSAIDEYAISGTDPIDRAVAVATAKAEAVLAQYPAELIIAADTYVVGDHRSLEKPKNRTEAIEMLLWQQRRELTEVTGICFINGRNHERLAESVTTSFSFRTLTLVEIESYVDLNPVTTWSAAFSPAYPAGLALISEVNGSLTGFTHGLPIEKVGMWLELQMKEAK